MSSDMLTHILSSDIESEKVSWKDRRIQIAENFINGCTWNTKFKNICKATGLVCKLENINQCALWNLVKHTLI